MNDPLKVLGDFIVSKPSSEWIVEKSG